jgi:aerobic-type carbon monoxide dehydrogenase small subunit (CoxS/CutS family)
MNDTVEFRINNQPIQLVVERDRTLLWVLRNDLGLTGSKFGCGEGVCGACTVLLNREPVRACQIAFSDVRGKEVLTIEGLAQGGKLHPLQQAFVDRDALQCGYCTPGMILNAYGLLLKKQDPTEKDIIEHMEHNLCRCGAHTRIVEAIQTAARLMRT